jgi:hypothetical protein
MTIFVTSEWKLKEREVVSCTSQDSHLNIYTFGAQNWKKSHGLNHCCLSWFQQGLFPLIWLSDRNVMYFIFLSFMNFFIYIIIELNLRASSCFSSSANVTVYFVLQRPWFYLFSDFFLHLINLGLWYAQITFHANIAEILLKVADNTMTITPWP